MAPPTLPGIPQANSKPVKPFLAASLETSIKATPPSATIFVPSTLK